MKRLKLLGLVAFGVALLVTGTVAGGAAEPKGKTLRLDFVAWFSPGSPEYEHVIVPFIKQEVPKLGNGRLKVDMVTWPELGLSGFEAVRFVGRRGADVVWFSYSYTGGEVPLGEAPEIASAGVTDAKTVVALMEAWVPVMNEAYRQKGINVKSLAVMLSPRTAFFCKQPVTGVGDLKGKRVRAWSSNQADLLGYLGAEGVTVAFAEVYSALERGVVDCALTGTGSANGQRWFEVASYQYLLTPDWPGNTFSVPRDWWESLPQDDQALVQEFVDELSQRLVKYTTEVSTQQGIACNAGLDSCTKLTKANPGMKTTSPSEKDLAKIKEAVEEVVLPRWVARCGVKCAEKFNEVLRPISGYRAPTK